MNISRFSFLRRVRIHGGESGAVARALHHKARINSLPAVKKNVFFTTHERKQMSNKTSFKRIALAVVVALGFGVLSTVPAKAVVNSDTLTLSSSTATATIGQASDSASAATVTLSFLATSPVDSLSLTASLVSSPATNTDLPELQLVETTASIVYRSPIGGDTGHMLLASAEAGALSDDGAARLNTTALQSAFFGSRVASNDPVFVAAKNRSISAATTISAKFKVYIPTPEVVGTYVVRLTPAITGNSGTTTLQSAVRDLTITVSAAACVRGCSAPTAAASWSSIYYQATDRGVALSDASNVTLRQGDSVINFTSALTTAGASQQAANILVYQQNADADIVYTGAIGAVQETASNEGGVESMTATISGPGMLGSGADNATATGRNLIIKAGNHVTVWNDGTSGVATITITGNTTGIVYATKTVNFYGTATTVEVTVGTNRVVNSGNLHYRFVSAVAKDANGIVNPVATNTLRLTSSDTLLLNQRMLAPDSSASTTYSTTVSNGVGTAPGAYIAYWNFSTNADVTRLSTTRNGEFSITVGTGGSTPVVGSLTSATTTIDSAAAVTIRLSNGIGGVTLAFDKATYRPGEQAILTLTATDSAGATAASATYASLLSQVEASGFSSGVPTTGSHTLVSGAKTFTFTMPNVETTAALVVKGSTSATANNTTSTLFTGSATATVADPAVTAANAATAAANEATAAANAAKDAAVEAANAAKDAAVEAANAAKTEAAAATAAAKAAQDAAVAQAKAAETQAAAATAAAKAAQDAAVAAAQKAATDAVAAAEKAATDAVAAAKAAQVAAVAEAAAATDASLEAIDAANAATDAANLAAEAADAATVAAEEARDAADAATAAVEALATEVATLIAALKAQITTLANVVAKIAKKVKA